MAKLIWDAAGQRLGSYGVSKCVIYHGNNSTVWNGITSVNVSSQNKSSETVYYDTVPIDTYSNPSHVLASVTAYTYPDIVDIFSGITVTSGVRSFGRYPVGRFNLSWQSVVVNDLGVEFPIIHILYNCSITPTDRAYETTSDSATPYAFSWEVTPVGERVYYQIDSRLMTKDAFSDFERMLYGTDRVNAKLPDADMLTLIATSKYQSQITKVATGLHPISLESEGSLSGSVSKGLYQILPGGKISQNDSGLHRLA